ncbi:hypothetical protein [Enterobacter phage vB_ExiM_F5M1E]|nr:hypothetical protein [Enterobacter phage vB_ExiM_F1M1E]UNA02968.1 hypothetical protein [Enterobacter phage vB_ExiM_F2M1E]UNA03289.1 hypothetical protein [Enterobacter phage vB_ExiM_F4M1E]UNA03609.1 hypothetical protein [Enterobacter phage vB_ExiM_F5M1E]UNA03930.1 hypothetical protein [Pantoea phage vB_PdiM_F5M2A]
MGWFTTKKKDECVMHNWRVTEALQITRHHDTPTYVVPQSHETQVSRVCKYCLKQEVHTVNGHISKEEAIDIYAGVLS